MSTPTDLYEITISHFGTSFFVALKRGLTVETYGVVKTKEEVLVLVLDFLKTLGEKEFREEV